MLKKLSAIVIIFLVLIGIFHKPIMKTVYKVDYKQAIDCYSKEYDVDKYLMYALIKRESKFDSSAVSRKGAIGLMQIMPETGEYIAKLLEDKNFNEEDLYDPEVNIKYGIYYFSKLYKDFDGSLEAVLAAYNGGEGNARKWLLEHNGNLNEDKIPFKETKNYVKKIKRDYKIYKYLYGNK